MSESIKDSASGLLGASTLKLLFVPRASWLMSWDIDRKEYFRFWRVHHRSASSAQGWTCYLACQVTCACDVTLSLYLRKGSRHAVEAQPWVGALLSFVCWWHAEANSWNQFTLLCTAVDCLRSDDSLHASTFRELVLQQHRKAHVAQNSLGAHQICMLSAAPPWTAICGHPL